jgi:hypothetical protein
MRADYPNLSFAQLQHLVENDINHTMATQNAGDVIAGVAAGQFGIAACTGTTNCAALTSTSSAAGGSLPTATYGGAGGDANVTAASAAAVEATQAAASSQAAKAAQAAATVASLGQQIVGHSFDSQWFIDQMVNNGWTSDQVAANMRAACIAAIGTANACK